VPWGRCTAKGSRLYLHVFDWPSDGRLVVPLKGGVSSARLLSDPSVHLNCGDGATIALPARQPDPIATVVAVDLAS
jgi:alpha-L-fucosidase